MFPTEQFKKQPYVVIAQLESAEGEEAAGWEGKIGALKTFIGKQAQHHQEELTKIRKENAEKFDRLALAMNM